jgi:hypothetical protein
VEGGRREVEMRGSRREGGEGRFEVLVVLVRVYTRLSAARSHARCSLPFHPLIEIGQHFPLLSLPILVSSLQQKVRVGSYLRPALTALA